LLSRAAGEINNTEKDNEKVNIEDLPPEEQENKLLSFFGGAKL
jgi:hypothetical protein